MHPSRTPALLLGLTTLAALGLAARPAQAQISGFNGGTAFQSNGTASVSGGTVTLTDNQLFEAGSLFSTTPQNIDHFFVTFTYQTTGGNSFFGLADGAAFVLQNDARGAAALGNAGGGLGYGGITPSAAIEFNHYPNNPSTAFATNGQTGVYNSTLPVNLNDGHPISVVLSYDGTTFTESLADGATVYNASYVADLSTVLQGHTALVGFTGATGGGTSTQTVSNFTFSNIAPAAVPEPSSVASTGLGSVGLLGLLLRARKRRPAA